MKKNILFIFALFCSLHLAATNIIVHGTNGNQQLQDIAIIGKWVFVGEELQLLDKAGNILASESIAEIRKITFAPNLTAVEDIETTDILVYPNPTQDILHIKGASEPMLRVYDLQGRLLQVEKGTQLSVSDLSSGTYLLQIGTQVIRFIKR